jgi:glutamyl-tRNA reductase
MHLHCIGLNHQTAPISVRERLAFSDSEIKAAISRYGCGGGGVSGEISEVVILSTCNRVEIYAVAPSYAMGDLEAFLINERRLSDDDLKNSLYRLVDEAVVDHLFRVAAGLDSLVIGEPQILGQVMHALELARGQNTTGRVLSRLFEFALRAGKSVRTETAIGQNPTSVASVAIHLASQTISDFPSAKILVIGAGEMAEMAIAALKKRGVSHLRVVNRTLSRAEQLANRFGGEAHTFGALAECLSWADVVITSTGAPHTILQKDMLNEIMEDRSKRPLVLIDIAVPRDIDADVAQIPGVNLYDLDMLEEFLGVSLELRAQQIPKAELILNEFSNEFKVYLQMLDVFPLIAALHQRAEMIRQIELEKTIGRLPDLNDIQRKHLHLLTKALVKKILNAPTRQLRSAAGSPQALEYASLARELFDLDEKQLIV